MATLPVPDFQSCRVLAETLEYHEYKPSVTLVRHGIIPDPRDKTLLAQIPKSLFDKLYNTTEDGVWTLRPLGRIFFGVSTRPTIPALLISLILAQIPSLDDRKTLIGPDTKKFFRRLMRDEVESLEYSYVALKDLTTRQLQELGIYEHTLGSITRPVKRRQFRHFEIFDPDDPVILSLNLKDPMNLAGEETTPFMGALDTDYLSY